MAKSIYEARRESAQRTAQTIQDMERDGVLTEGDEEPLRRRLIDKRELRGWPACARGVSGAIAGSTPGTGPLFDDE